jgi:putative transposase
VYGRQTYEKHDQQPKQTTNRRNGAGEKTVCGHSGEMALHIPRDREGRYEPQLIKKGQSDISDSQEKVMSMYAKGLSNRDISAVIHEIYGFDVSHDTVSRIVERVQPRFTAWQSRPLEKAPLPSGLLQKAAGQFICWCIMTRFLNYDTKGRVHKNLWCIMT